MKEQENEKSQHSDIRKSPVVDVVRLFHAPIERVWAAWSEPALIEQWWGPENFTCPKALVDFREGGRYLSGMKSPEGEVLWSTGIYKEILPMEKIVCTDQFADEQGHVILPSQAGMKDWPDDVNNALIIVTFEEQSEGEVTLHLLHEGIPASQHDECVKGWGSCFDKLQRVVESH